MKLIPILLILANPVSAAHAPAYEKVTAAILKVIANQEVTVFGEKHSLRDSRRVLMKVLEQGVQNGTIDAFATEYVVEEFEPDFQAYLRNPEATKDSEAERAFFEKVMADFIWPADAVNRDFYRLLRDLQLKNPNFKICGLDVRVSTDIEVRAERFKGFPPQLMRAAEEAFKIKVDEMVNQTNSNFDREPLMGLRAHECLAGAKHGLAHMGGFHARSRRFPAQPDWQDTAHFMRVLRPGATIPVIFTALPTRTAHNEIDQLDQLFARMNSLLQGKNRDSITLIDTADPQIQKALMKSKTTAPLAKAWDYLILGPEGETAEFKR